ncbi:MAG TPA: DUF4386 domain-containing protein [Actinomycetota bacterium]|nr:DUF4386 domain-containing protein [Actinomycetota bacterium]
MDTTRRTARVAGVLFIITFLTSIPAALLLYTPVLEDASYIVGAGAGDAGVALGAFLEVLLIVANVGTAVVLYPVLKRQSEALALGYVSARLVECTFIAIGIVSLLSVLTLRQDFAGAGGDPGTFETVGQSLVAIHDWTFLLGPGFIGVVGTGLILGWLMYRSGLVPRWMARLGLVGGPLVCASAIGVLFGVFEAGSAPQVLATAPEFVWELSLGIYLMVKGFKPSPITTGMAAAGAPPAYHEVDA